MVGELMSSLERHKKRNQVEVAEEAIGGPEVVGGIM